MSKQRLYYTLLELLPGDVYTIQFGDFDKKVVKDEIQVLKSSGGYVRGTKYTIIETNPDQKA